MKAITTSQNAHPETTGTKLAMMPMTATATAIQKVISLGALSLMFTSRKTRLGDLRGSVTIGLVVEGLSLFASANPSWSAPDVKRGNSAEMLEAIGYRLTIV